MRKTSWLVGVLILQLALRVWAQTCGNCCTAPTCGLYVSSEGCGCSCDDTCVQSNNCCANFFSTCLVPLVSSISPVSSNSNGGTITVRGLFFGDGAAVEYRSNCYNDSNPPPLGPLGRPLWNLQEFRLYQGTLATSILVCNQTWNVVQWSDNQIICNLPPEIRSQNLNPWIRNKFRFSGNNTGLFFSVNRPTTTSVTPPTLGPTTGGRIITITGNSFTLFPTATVGGRDCPVINATHTRVVCTVPAGGGFVQEIRIRTALSLSSGSIQQSNNNLRPNYDAPSISSVTPLNGPTAGGVVLTLIGTNFGVSPEVRINNVVCGLVAGSLLANHTSVRCNLPVGVGASLSITLHGPWVSTSFSSFSYNRPNITAFGGTSLTSGGGIISMSGINFGASNLINSQVTMTMNEKPVTILNSSNHNRIFAVAPAGEGQNVPVTFTVGGQQPVNPVRFSYIPPAINLLNFSSSATRGGGRLTLSGSSFSLSGSVSVNDKDCSIISYNHTHIICSIPPGSGAVNPVRVSVSGVLSNSRNFAYSPPQVTAVSPLNGPTDGSVFLTVFGANFASSGVVTIGGQNCVQNGGFWNDSVIICRTPEFQGTNLSISINVAGQISDVLGSRFNYDPPQIIDAGPSFGPTSGGTVLSIFGSNFGVISGASVRIGSLSCLIQSQTHSLILCLTPSGTGQNLTVSLTVGGQNLFRALT